MNMTKKIAVAGATGRVGHHVVTVLQQRGIDVVPMARSLGVDVITCEGLAEALVGVDGVIDAAAGGPSPEPEAATEFFTRSARNLHEFGMASGVRRMVVVSIIGCDRFTAGYFAANAAHERAVQAGSIPVQILRAAQFHELVETLIDWGTQGDVSYVPDMRSQLVSARTVAEALVDLATTDTFAATNRDAPLEIAGPRSRRSSRWRSSWRRGGAARARSGVHGSHRIPTTRSGTPVPSSQARTHTSRARRSRRGSISRTDRSPARQWLGESPCAAFERAAERLLGVVADAVRDRDHGHLGRGGNGSARCIRHAVRYRIGGDRHVTEPFVEQGDRDSGGRSELDQVPLTFGFAVQLRRAGRAPGPGVPRAIHDPGGRRREIDLSTSMINSCGRGVGPLELAFAGVRRGRVGDAGWIHPRPGRAARAPEHRGEDALGRIEQRVIECR